MFSKTTKEIAHPNVYTEDARFIAQLRRTLREYILILTRCNLCLCWSVTNLMAMRLLHIVGQLIVHSVPFNNKWHGGLESCIVAGRSHPIPVHRIAPHRIITCHQMRILLFYFVRIRKINCCWTQSFCNHVCSGVSLLVFISYQLVVWRGRKWLCYSNLRIGGE